ncbi:DNA repair helicase (rad3) and DEAD_2 domain containing protein [Babesia bovis T2Bo]|uniref:DNA repair helicase (Rad3) and DEAD_2 domain containing protein n=1 Tax=Babesia bovis TaxID=5865 RepID=A7AWW5_BABBO|nr:DNA repair helicase (rad3) and DEAD_2 domain containing protein [Babesia bovis T2Bo]EDO05543.1 DNA repair helicase (rad3) and DEAD_2 domain containing protein [Babesia bovis T2Bo]|eukprot:XP_001609111.1 DNA repair helicase (rad3) and DEAD_2 domain containing protein [Babesia bovis T2Bo]
MESQKERVFSLPFEPYPSQKRLMHDSYRCIEESDFGLFESPTGSGKTIAMLCSALTWLDENRINDAVERLKRDDCMDTNVPKWALRSIEAQHRLTAECTIAYETEELAKIRERLSCHLSIDEGGIHPRYTGKRRRELVSETKGHLGKTTRLQRDKVQIIICSRTFSQLNQYVKEFRRLGALSKNVKIGFVTGRSHTCINESVRSNCHTNEEFNEQCCSISCDLRDDVSLLMDASIAYPMDLEDLRVFGTAFGACPYYASNKNVKDCDVLLVPYISVFNESIRQSMNLKIEDNILIIDEAHNLLSAMSEAQSGRISGRVLCALIQQCRSYLNKNGSTMTDAAKDSMSALSNLCQTFADCKTVLLGNRISKASQVFTIPRFLVALGLESACLHSTIGFLSSDDFCKNMRYFGMKVAHRLAKALPADQPKSVESDASAVYTFRHFISTLLSASLYDRVIFTPSTDDFEIEVFNVSADERFRSMTRDAKSILLMSGTLTPIEEFISLSPFGSDVIIHKAPPVFPIDRFYVSVLAADDQGSTLVYDSNSREQKREISVLFNLIERLSSVVPNGIVCFLSSYTFLESFQSAFERAPERVNILRNKKVFFESRDKNVDTFGEYSKVALTTGAILFGVYGGSQSEGVDFHDGLARLVLLVGLPYPPETVKLRLRRSYLKCRASQVDLPLKRREFYNMLSNDISTITCYKIVNQSIGRAMRHKDDFAALVLLDARYNDEKNRSYLPDYVVKSLSENGNLDNPCYGSAKLIDSLRKFYESHASKT